MENRAQYVARRRREEEEHRRKAEADEAQSKGGLDWGGLGKQLAGQGGQIAGAAAGVTRGAANLARGITDTFNFAGRLLDPYDAEASARGQAAWDQVLGGANQAAQVVTGLVSHPQATVRNLGKVGIGPNVRLPLRPEPTSPTTGAEFKKQFDRGMDVGEGVFDVGAMIAGPAELSRLKDLGYFGKLPTVETYLAEGVPPRIAEYFATPYTGRSGSHFVPQRTRLPGGGKIPKPIMDSAFNRVMPAPRATTGQMAKFHFSADDRLQGGKVRAQNGGGGWSGKQLGWVRPVAPVRWWRGMPLPTKALGLAGLVGLGSFVPDGDEAEP